MKIAYLGKFDYPYNTEVYVQHALEQHGCYVKRCPFREHTLKSLTYIIKREKPDAFLFSKISPAYLPQVIDQCRQAGVKTITWLWDLYWGYRSKLPDHAQPSDLLFTTDGGHNKQFERAGCNHQLLRQGIHEPEHVIYDYPYDYDVAFVGGRKGHRSRPRLINWLNSNYHTRFIHYQDVRGLELNNKLSRVKIVVGDSYPSPNYWSNRIYEVCGRGGFLLHPHTRGLEEEFTDGEHYVSYQRNNFNHLRSLIEHYVQESEERERIRYAGWHQCKQYTYTNRVTALLAAIQAPTP